MATHTGSEGTVKVGANAVAEIRSFSLEESGEVIETTTMGDVSRTYVAGLNTFSASIEVYWDETDTDGQVALAVGSTVVLSLYPEGAEVVAMETAVAEDNALMGNLAYILGAGMYGALKTTAKDAGSGQFVVGADGQINGYNAIVSNQVTAGDLYFGNFADLLIGMYGGLDIVADPYSNSTSGTVNITALQTVDVAVRNSTSFAFNSDGV